MRPRPKTICLLPLDTAAIPEDHIETVSAVVELINGLLITADEATIGNVRFVSMHLIPGTSPPMLRLLLWSNHSSTMRMHQKNGAFSPYNEVKHGPPVLPSAPAKQPEPQAMITPATTPPPVITIHEDEQPFPEQPVQATQPPKKKRPTTRVKARRAKKTAPVEMPMEPFA